MVNARRSLSAGLLVAVAAIWPALATAGDNVLYRCVDGAGNPVFSNTRQGYADCRELGRYPKASDDTAASVQALPASPVSGAMPSPASATPPAAAVPVTATAPVATAGTRVRRGAVYRFDRDGVIHYTNVKPKGGQAQLVFTYAIDTCIACNVRSTVDWSKVALRLDEYDTEITAAATAYGVDEALIRAIIHAESAFRVNARSHKGAQGLMQLIPATAARFGVIDAYDAAQNIAGGVQYLAFLLKRFNGDTRLAAAGYNAGEGAVDRHGGVPPYDETQVYVERVGILHARYRSALDAVAPTVIATTGAP